MMPRYCTLMHGINLPSLLPARHAITAVTQRRIMLITLPASAACACCAAPRAPLRLHRQQRRLTATQSFSTFSVQYLTQPHVS
ncbi:hypothetical protein [Burkholderia pseudomallei]|uniref:hypothetical protein n=1 Tax=Burkholderia pseudomallei TaxID=28450 RepID=UPI000F095BC3|nr:hypothetical protein [Burkholderia pseudomallei]VCJ27872.1 Uncharacterised protein [Burkholderia pseudomallei]VCJ29048.1 Uncharacterised protein [Burkholderia pseudomallei]